MRWLAVDYQRDYARPTRSRRTRPATEQASAAAPALDERRQGAGRIGAIEGIRTLSIVAILLYHADPSWLPGGFFGVSVFFVLTGYLTTISLEREIERTGGVDYLRFVVRRLVRLVPSVVVAVGVTTVLCSLFAHPLLPKLKSDVLSALLFFENIHYILSDVPYFAAAGLPSSTPPMVLTLGM